MFSPILPTSAVRTDSTAPSPSGRLDSAATSAGFLLTTSSTQFLVRAWNSSFLATKSVSQLTSMIAPCLPSAVMLTATRPSAVIRAAALVALLPSLTRRISSALPRSPSASVRAFLHSIIGASVFARSSATMLAVIAAIFHLHLRARPENRPCLVETTNDQEKIAFALPGRRGRNYSDSSTNSSSEVAAMMSSTNWLRPSRIESATPRAYRRIALDESSLPGMT